MLVASGTEVTKASREIPTTVSYYKLNSDGSYESATVLHPSVYISEDQIWRIWDPQVAMFIRRKYGPYVGVIHDSSKKTQPPIFPTFKYVLG